MPDLAAKTLMQKRRITLDPTPDRDVIDRQATIRHHLFQIPAAQRITQVPPDAQENEDIFEVSPAKQHGPVLAHRITVLKPPSPFATDPIAQ
jgi:hypothetical protein